MIVIVEMLSLYQRNMNTSKHDDANQLSFGKMNPSQDKIQAYCILRTTVMESNN